MKHFLYHMSQISILGISLTMGLVGNANAFTITPTNSGSDLANTILGEGISVVPGSINYSGADGASGFFTDGMSSGIGIDSGIILTSGQATNALPPNDSDSEGAFNGFAGDSDLTALSGFNTFDAAVLEFEFESEGGDLFFDFVFASDEYNEFANGNVNDVFGFFLDGDNIALIPGTDTPISINTVNGGNPLGTNANNPQFFNNNDLEDGGPFFDIEYDGFTDVFQAEALGLSAGTHTIKLAIADGGDSIYDSAVFIAANSFSDEEDPVDPVDPPISPDPDTVKTPEPLSIMSLLAVGLFGCGSIFKRSAIRK